MLKAVRFLNWSASFSYAPPIEEATINTDTIVSAVPIDPDRSRCYERTMKVSFVDGSHLEIVGKPSDLIT